MKNLLTRALLLIAFALALMKTNAELMPDMKLLGDKSGVIKGELTQKGKEGLWAVSAYNLEIQSPTDSTGETIGKRVFKPVSLVVPAGQLYTPALHNLLASNELLKTVDIRFWAPANNGIEMLYLTVRLTNARVVSLRDWVANIKDTELVKFTQQHQVDLVYEKIEWLTPKGSATDGPRAIVP